MTAALTRTASPSREYADIYTDQIEHVPDLLWPSSVDVYSRMRTDPKLAGILAAYTLPLRRATWSVDPAGCRPEVARLVADDLGLPILGQDSVPGAARRRGVDWIEHLRIAVEHLVFGFMPFEKTYDTSDGKTARLVQLSERLPATVSEIAVARSGELIGMGQNLHDRLVPRKNLVWYVNGRQGASWQGQSLLRPAFAPWLLKHEMWRVHGTSIRRFGMGIPSVEAPAGATPQQVAEAHRMATSMRVGDQSGAGLPPGFKLALTGLTGSVPDALGFIGYLDQQLSQMALLGLLDLGSTPNGSRALGDTFLDLFMLSLQAIAGHMASIATADISVDLVDLNWGETEPAPRIVCGDVGADHQVTAEALNALLTSGALSADPALEAWVRKEWKLPERDGDAPYPATADRTITARAGRRARQAQAHAHPAGPRRDVRAQLRRELTPVELAAGTDFARIQNSWESALDKLIKEWGSKITPPQADSLVEQIRQAVDDGDVDALTSLSLDSGPAGDLLAQRMLELAVDAAQDQADEFDSQGVELDPGDPDDDRLISHAKAASSFAAAGLTLSAARKALSAWGEDATPGSVATAVRDHLDSLTDSALRDLLGGSLTTAQGEGRRATVTEAAAQSVQMRYFASELLDAATCDPCGDVDGSEFVTLDDALQDYPTGQFVDCLGRDRCRGMVIVVVDNDDVLNNPSREDLEELTS